MNNLFAAGDGASLGERTAVRYVGRRANGVVTVIAEDEQGRTRLLAPRRDLRDHSPNGFEWGYGGSGPAQLALALLADAAGDERARACYQAFKFQVVAGLQTAEWELSRDQVVAWVQSRRA